MKDVSFFQFIPIIGAFIVAGIFCVLSRRKTAQRLAAATHYDTLRHPVFATITSIRRLKRKSRRLRFKVVKCGPQEGDRGMLIELPSAGKRIFVKRVPATIANSPCTHFQAGNGRLLAI